MKIDTGQIVAVLERLVTDVGDAVSNRDAGQSRADSKHIVPNAGDVVSNHDAGQNGAEIERPVSNAGDRQAINRIWNNHITACTGELVDVERAVVIGRVVELSLHHGGQR